MHRWTTRQSILMGCASMAMAMIGDYLLGYGTIEMTSAPGAYMGLAWNVVPDWRYSVSSILGFGCAALFAIAAVTLMRVMEGKYALGESRLYKLFKTANWGGILYFAFIHMTKSTITKRRCFRASCPPAYSSTLPASSCGWAWRRRF